MPGMKLLRAAALCSSLTLLFGCVWFTQKQANPTMMPSSKLLVLPSQTPSKSVMPGSKSIAPLLTPSQTPNTRQMIMPGSKSYTGGTTISSGALQTSKPQTPVK